MTAPWYRQHEVSPGGSRLQSLRAEARITNLAGLRVLNGEVVQQQVTSNLPSQQIFIPKATIDRVQLVALFSLHGVYSSWR